MYDVKYNLSQSIAPYDNNCDGYGNLGATGNGYLLGVFLGVGKTEKKFSHQGSKMLDEINAFDIAETDGPYIGQINMSIVSSFCGPQGAIWGYDLVKAQNLRVRPERSSYPQTATLGDLAIPVYPIEPLIDATRFLFGSVDKRNFNLKPGAHVPCAGKNIKIDHPGIVYSGVAIGIPKDRSAAACLLMEDVGFIPLEHKENLVEYEDMLRQRLANSILEIGKNQLVEYQEVFVGVKSIEVNEGEVGCALVACPYFTLAKKAIPVDETNDMNYSFMIDCDIIEWSAHIAHDSRSISNV